MAGAVVVDAPLVVDANVVSGSGSGAALSVALALLERITDARTATKVRALMAVPDSMLLAAPPAPRNEPPQRPLSPGPLPPAATPPPAHALAPVARLPGAARPPLGGPQAALSPRVSGHRGPAASIGPIASAPPPSFAANDYGSTSLVEAQRRNSEAATNATNNLATVNVGGQAMTGSKSEVEEAALRKILELQDQTNKQREQAEKAREAMAKIQAAQSDMEKQKQRAQMLERTMSQKGGVKSKAGPKCEF